MRTMEKRKVQIWIIIALIAGVFLGALLKERAYATNNDNESTMLSPLPNKEALSDIRTSTVQSVIRGEASWYGNSDAECLGCSANRITASGRKFDEMGFTAACSKRWSLGTTLEVRYKAKMVRVICTDRGGFERGYGRVMDLSKASFAELAPLDKGVIDVEVRE
ncbi:hypothetical protein HZB78_05460 [Candidatus Collierbacteria bacterium]|nr:hypothetical protein [Candidatus Collierbacteria bacterium]